MPAPKATDDAFEHRWAAIGWRGLRVSSLLVWIGIGSYAWFRSTQPELYTITVLGAVVGITLAAKLFGRTSGKTGGSYVREAPSSWLLVGGCLVGVFVGTTAVAGSAEQVGASQSALSTLTAVGAVLLCGALLVVACRQSTALAALAGVSIAVSWASTPTVALVETAVFGASGIYGPLTQAAVTWIGPVCLIFGCWRAAGTDQRFITLWNATANGWPTAKRDHRLGRLTAGVGASVLLAGWQTGAVGPRTIAGLAVLPVGILGIASVRAASRETTGSIVDGQPSTADLHRGTWLAPTLMVGGPLGVVAVVGGGYRLPVGTAFVAGCLCCLGLSLVRPHVLALNNTSTVRPTGIGTVLDGSIIGCQLMSRVVVPLAVVGGSISLLEAAGLTTRLLTGVSWLSGGHPIAVVFVVAGCCVALGALFSVVGGYAVGALVGVPLLRLLGSVPELFAHVVVLSGVMIGWLFVDWRVRTTVTKPNGPDS